VSCACGGGVVECGLGSSVRRVASRRRRASTITHRHTHKHVRRSLYTSDCVRVYVCVCMLAAAIKTRPAESLATLPAYDRVCECCDVRVRVRACVYVSRRASVRAGACAAGPGVNDETMPKLYRAVCSCVRVFSLLFFYHYYYYSVVNGHDVRGGRAALSSVSVR